MKGFELVTKNEEFVRFFRDLGEPGMAPDECAAAKFICRLYGFPRTTDVNEARYLKLQAMTGKIAEVSSSLELPCVPPIIIERAVLLFFALV